MEVSHDRTVVSLAVPGRLAGRPLTSLRLGERHGIECLGILRGPELVRVSDAPELGPDDVMLLLGRTRDLQRFGEAHCH